MVIRQAQVKDIDSVLKLLKQVNLIHHNGRPDIFKSATKYSPAELEEIIKDKNRPVLVAEDEGIIKGYAFCVYIKHENDNMLTDIKTLYLDDLCVDGKARGNHIGKSLYDAVLELAKQNNCHNVTLNVWWLNKSALKFYEKCGMQPLKICMEKVLD